MFVKVLGVGVAEELTTRAKEAVLVAAARNRGSQKIAPVSFASG